jgi:hypothetical protein
VIALLLLLQTAEADTAVVARSLPPADAAALTAACAERYACAEPSRVAEAMADAVGLGISCADDDATCWQRFLAAEGFARVIIATRRASGAAVWVVESEGEARSAEGATATDAFGAAHAPRAEPPPTAETSPPPDDARSGSGAVVLVVAGLAGAVALASGFGAALVSADLARSLDEAAAGREPLRDYGSRNALFFSLVAASAVAAVAGGSAAVFALMGEP